MVGVIRSREGAFKLRLETVEGFALRTRLVTPYQIANILAD